MKEKIYRFKQELNKVFDDTLHTKQWHNIVDYIIITLIIISTIEVFLSTYEGVVERFGKVLHVIDWFTTVFFTVEVSLRIWCADLLNPKYKGFWGRVRYCFSFYGLIDILSTFPFYLQFFMPFPYMVLKSLRIARLLRIFRYMKAFSLLSRAINSKKQEMIVSLQFLTIVTLILSFILFFVEHEAQPDVYTNGWKSVIWAFLQYIGDPGGFAETPPITVVGRLIACIIGILGIAIFAVPAGLIGSAFTDVMSEDQAEAEVKGWERSIITAFKWEKDQHYTNLFHVTPYKDFGTLLQRKLLTEAQVVEAVKQSDCLHICNLANTVNSADNPIDRVVVVNYARNTVYGCCIDRGSKVTLVSTSGSTEPLSSWLAYHIAKLGGFNYIAKENEVDADNPVTYYNINSVDDCPNFKLFQADLNRLAAREGSWVIPILGAMGPRSRPSQFHFCYNRNKKDSSYNDPTSLIKDYTTFDALYNMTAETLEKQFGYKSDKNEYYAVSEKNIGYFIKADNIFTLRVECYTYVFEMSKFQLIKTLADSIAEVLEPNRQRTLPSEMVTRPVGHDFGFADYID